MLKKIIVWGLLIAIGHSGAARVATLREERWDKLSSEKSADLILEVIKYFEESYVDPKKTGRKELLQRALNGILSADPHSCYFKPEEYQTLCDHTRGEFGGLGMEVTWDNGAIKVVAPIDDTPAARAGLKAKDLIIAIDGTPVIGMSSVTEAVGKMRGKPGTSVKLLIKREGVKTPFLVTLVRQIIAIKSVKWRTEGDIGYIRISTFDEKVTDLLEKAIRELRSSIGKSFKGFVIDLRDNPGGLLDQAISVANLFIDRGLIVSTKGRRPEHDSVTKAIPGNAIVGEVPVVVLINEGSASASEIVAGALQDHKKALIVGETSFGKGSVQNLLPLSGGENGAIKLTVARFYTPSGHAIQGKGIEPDVVIRPMSVVEAQTPFQIREKDLMGSLSSEEKKQQMESTSVKSETAPAESSETAPSSAKPVEDYQLARALEIVKALSVFFLEKPKSER